MNGEIVFSYAGHYHDNLPNPHHSHRGAELVLVTAGSCETAFDNGVTLKGGPGTVLVTPPELAHQQSNSPECETFYAVMEMAGSEFSTELCTVETGNDALIRQWFANLQELNIPYSAEQGSALLAAIWARLTLLEQQSDNRRTLHPGVRAAVAHIEKHYMEPIAVSELAERSGVSQSHLNSLFRRSFGVGPLNYLTAVRMRQARLLLLNPYFNISEVAARTGFREANYFTRAFRLFHGVTPGEYRASPSETADRLQVYEPGGSPDGAAPPRRPGSNSIIA